MDRKKIVQKFHNEDVNHKEHMGRKCSARYLKKQKALKRLESKDFQASRVSASGRSNEVKVYSL